jgi:hypothetical protein
MLLHHMRCCSLSVFWLFILTEGWSMYRRRLTKYRRSRWRGVHLRTSSAAFPLRRQHRQQLDLDVSSSFDARKQMASSSGNSTLTESRGRLFGETAGWRSM